MAFLCCIFFTEHTVDKDKPMNQIMPITARQAVPLLPNSSIKEGDHPSTSKRSNTAKRLAKTKNMEHQEWLEVRKQY